ncbi:MAG TPA: NAD(P)/FAD-dependent oxidoreductase [Longimicrobium sp.]|nr:NAD(P)/FAD-dependent oxidoreductase [Longimicrobium sp.]
MSESADAGRADPGAADEAPVATVVGAGPAGAAMAVYLGRRGWRVNVFERRRDPRAHDAEDGRSFNLGLSLRGLLTLRDLEVADRVLAGAVRARGRVIHPVEGETRFQPYGRSEDECLWSISRRALTRALIDRAEALPGVRFWFEEACVEVEKETGAAVFRDPAGATRRVEADLVVGADGAFSAVRERMQRGEQADYAREFLPWGYKEIRLSAAADGASRVFLEALHVWPRGDCVVVTHPNQDGSHTCTLFLAHQGGPRSFAALHDDGRVEAFFAGTFPDLAALVPDLLEQWRRHPQSSLVATRTSMWHWGGRVVLVGDACHAVYPFYGQGMNAAMEDCLVLDRCLARAPGDRAAALAEYQALRKENTDALHTLVSRNFVELRETSASPVLVWQKQVDFVLNRLFPQRWLPPYSMVVHSTMPYAEALRRADRQARIRRLLGIDLAILLVAVPLAVLRGRLARGWARPSARRAAGAAGAGNR